MQDVVFLMKQQLEWLLGTLGYRKCIECVSNSSGNVDIGPLKCFRKITYACFASHFQSRWERPGRWTWKKNLKELKGAFSYSAGWKVLFISTAGTHPSIDQWLSVGGGGCVGGGCPDHHPTLTLIMDSFNQQASCWRLSARSASGCFCCGMSVNCRLLESVMEARKCGRRAHGG